MQQRFRYVRSRSLVQPSLEHKYQQVNSAVLINYPSGTSDSGTGAFRKIIHTPTRTSAAPNNDERGNVSPPNNQPSTTAPGGVMSEILCSCATVRRGSSQYKSRNVNAEPITAR